MTLERAIEILEEWKKGINDTTTPLLTPREITEAIDTVVACHKRQYENWPREKTNK